MTQAITTTDPIETFRAKAATRFHSAADMSLHELVDEFQSLTAIMASDTSVDPENTYLRLVGDNAQVAMRERQIVNAAAKSRFGIALVAFDRGEDDDTF